MTTRQSVLQAVTQITALPSAAAAALPMLYDHQSDIRKVAHTIEHDPGLAGNVLKLANSALYGSGGKVASVQQAIVRLGYERVGHLVVATSVCGVAQPAVDGYGLHSGELWQASVGTALAAGCLAQALGVAAPDHTFTAGLLHDVGKLALGTFVHDQAQRIWQLAFEKQLPFEEAEQQVLGIDHAEAGAVLLESWHLPESIVQVVRWHHQPECFTGHDTVAMDLVHAACHLVPMIGLGIGCEGMHHRISRQTTQRLRIKPADLEKAACETLVKLDAVREAFGIVPAHAAKK